jgi:AraC-like DNA-binding protein
MFVKFYRFDAQAKREIYRMGDIFPAWFELYGFIFLNIQTIGYIVAALLVLRSYRTEIKNRLSSVEKMNLPWLSFVLYALLVTHFTGTIKHFVYRYLGIYSEFLAAVLLTSYFFFPVIIVYYGLKNPEIFSGVEKDGTDKKWSLPKSYADHYAEKLRHFMETDKPYLTPGITIDDLAKRIGISPRNLSSILNTHFNRNFFDFINQYRVNEAKRRLADASEKHNVMQVLFDVGFNSKSAFYTAFKKYTGISPSRYQET